MTTSKKFIVLTTKECSEQDKKHLAGYAGMLRDAGYTGYKLSSVTCNYLKKSKLEDIQVVKPSDKTLCWLVNYLPKGDFRSSLDLHPARERTIGTLIDFLAEHPDTLVVHSGNCKGATEQSQLLHNLKGFYRGLGWKNRFYSVADAEERSRLHHLVCPAKKLDLFHIPVSAESGVLA